MYRTTEPVCVGRFFTDIAAMGHPVLANGGTIRVTSGFVNLSNLSSGGLGGFTKTGEGALNLDGSATHGAGSAIHVNEGTLRIGNDPREGGTRMLTVDVANGFMSATWPTVQLYKLRVAAGQLASLDEPEPQAMSAEVLEIEGSGRLDVRTNKVVIVEGDVGTASDSTYSGLSGLIQSAHHAGAWDGPGITTTMPDAVSGLTSIGIATAGESGYAGGTFGGLSVSSADVLVMYTYAGDANLDGIVSGDDYSAIDFNIAVIGSSGWVNGDFNYDGFISGDNYTVIDFNIVAQGVPFPTSARIPGITAVPEPVGTLAWLAGGLTLRRRVRRPMIGNQI